MIIDELSFHDSLILKITEDEQSLHFLLDFPIDWENNIYENKILKFEGVVFYCIEEIPFRGKCTILDIVNFGQIRKCWSLGKNQIEVIRTKAEIQTNSGKRIIEFSNCDLINV
jgi:hypothetical protein